MSLCGIRGRAKRFGEGLPHTLSAGAHGELEGRMVTPGRVTAGAGTDLVYNLRIGLKPNFSSGSQHANEKVA